MRVLFHVGHPAHVHLFRNLMLELDARGHQTWMGARDKDVAVQLLDGYGLNYQVISRQGSGYAGLFLEFVEYTYRLYQMAREFNPDLMVGCSASAGLISKICPAKSVIFSEDDPDTVRIAALLTYPPADIICMPDSITSAWPKRISHPSYHELAYLHPNRFTPSPGVLSRLGVQAGEPYYILRFVSLKAVHDKGASGLTLAARRKLVSTLSKRGRVFITSEAALSEEFEPYRIPISPLDIHDALYYATMFIGDSQSMTMEAAILGTPAIRCNTFVGRCSVIEELEHKYGLTYGFLPGRDEEKMFSKIMELLDDKDLHAKWQERRAKMLGDKVDLTAWMIDFVEHYEERVAYRPASLCGGTS
jgi:predicted glycosyltransferase